MNGSTEIATRAKGGTRQGERRNGAKTSSSCSKLNFTSSDIQVKRKGEGTQSQKNSHDMYSLISGY